MSLKPTSGRTGLDKIEVTPAVFLQLRAQLTAGKNLPFTEPQLLIAFSRYLHDTKGKWTRSQIKGTRELHKFAEEYVAKETRILKQKFGQDSKPSASPQAAKRKSDKAEKYIDDHGLKLLDDKDLSFFDDAPQELSSLLSSTNMKRGADATEIVGELFAIARSAEPATAVAAILLSHSLLPNMSSMAIDGTHILIDKFDKRSKTSQEKDIVLHGLEIVTADLEPTHFNQEMARLQEKEKNNPHAAADHLQRIEQMRGASRDKAAQITDTTEKLSLYRDNVSTMDVAVRDNPAPEAHVQAVAYRHPAGTIWDLSKGPKPPTEEIFGTTHKTEERDT